MKIAMIMLAAGNSRRFGANKLLYEIDGIPMYRHVLEQLDDTKKKIENIYSEYSDITEDNNSDIVQLNNLYRNNIDYFARDVAYTYTRPLQKYHNPRGGQFHAGLYPVSANVPLGGQTGATPDGRYAHTPVADGVSPSAGKDVNGPTAAATSVSRLDHFIVSNGTLLTRNSIRQHLPEEKDWRNLWL
mgnify:CR=1 FL=1